MTAATLDPAMFPPRPFNGPPLPNFGNGPIPLTSPPPQLNVNPLPLSTTPPANPWASPVPMYPTFNPPTYAPPPTFAPPAYTPPPPSFGQPYQQPTSYAPPSFLPSAPQGPQPLLPLTTGQPTKFAQQGLSPVDRFIGASSPGFVNIPAGDLAAFAGAPPIGNIVAHAREATRAVQNFIGAGGGGVVDAFTSQPSQELFVTAVQSAPMVLGALQQAAGPVTGIAGGVVGASGEIAGWLAGPVASVPYVGGIASGVLSVYAPLAKVVGPALTTVGGFLDVIPSPPQTNNRGPLIRRVVA